MQNWLSRKSSQTYDKILFTEKNSPIQLLNNILLFKRQTFSTNSTPHRIRLYALLILNILNVFLEKLKKK